MRVKALQTGFYAGSRVRAGQEFDVPEGAKAKWFAPLGEFKAPASSKGKREPMTLAEVAKSEGKSFADVHEKKADLA